MKLIKSLAYCRAISTIILEYKCIIMIFKFTEGDDDQDLCVQHAIKYFSFTN